MTRVQHVWIFCICVAVLGEGPALSDQPKSDIPPSVAAILEKAVADTKAVLEATEGKVRAEVDRLTEQRKLDEAVAVRDFISKVRRAVTNQVVPSPIGKWSCNDPKNPANWVQFNADGSASASWHKEQCLWTSAGDGKIRMMIARNRFVDTADLSDDGSTLRLSETNAWSKVPVADKIADAVPSAVQPILDGAVSDIQSVLEVTDKALGAEMDRFTTNKQLDEAVVVRRIRGTFRAMVTDFVRPSLAGKWSWPDDKFKGQAWVQLNADGTASASWHGEPGLWTTAEDGRVRMLVTKTRFIVDGSPSADGKSVKQADGKTMEKLPLR